MTEAPITEMDRSERGVPPLGAVVVGGSGP